MEKFAKRYGHHIEVLDGIMKSIELYLKKPNNFVNELPNNLKVLVIDCKTNENVIEAISKHIIETIEKEYSNKSDNFICRSHAQSFISRRFPYVYNFSLNGGITDKSIDYKYVLKTYMRHVGEAEGCLFLDQHDLPPDVYNTLCDISRELGN